MTWMAIAFIAWLYLCGSFMAFRMAEDSGSDAAGAIVWMLLWPVLTPVIVIASFVLRRGALGEGTPPRDKREETARESYASGVREAATYPRQEGASDYAFRSVRVGGKR